jgi:acetyltransferase-like isoleucine patch superfamily enzyme
MLSVCRENAARTNVQDGCVLHADPGYPAIVGDDCVVGHNAIVHGCEIENGCLIGMGATILNWGEDRRRLHRRRWRPGAREQGVSAS